MDYLEYQEIEGSIVLYPPLSTTGKLTYNYKYSGKELQDELGLGVYDFGARNYDPALGRWMNIDPLASMYFGYSPYTYAMNNPVYFIDIDGMQLGGSEKPQEPEETIQLPILYINPPARTRSLDLSWINNILPDIDLGKALFGKDYIKNYEEFSKNANNRDFYTEFHKNDKKEVEIFSEILLTVVLPEVAIEAVIELGSMALATETVAVLEAAGQEGILTVIESEEAITAIAEGTKVVEESKVVEGIYEFTATSGETYVGQSENIAERLLQHIAKGKLKPGTPVTRTEVLGGKTMREISEQLRINELGGVKNLENIRNPIGKARQHLLPIK